MSEEKSSPVLSDATGYVNYMCLVKECGESSLPTNNLTKERMEIVANLDHFVFCAKNYSKREECDSMMKLHCKDVWKSLETDTFIQLLNLFIRNLLHPTPSSVSYLAAKVSYTYLMSFVK